MVTLRDLGGFAIILAIGSGLAAVTPPATHDRAALCRQDDQDDVVSLQLNIEADCYSLIAGDHK